MEVEELQTLKGKWEVQVITTKDSGYIDQIIHAVFVFFRHFHDGKNLCVLLSSLW